MAGGTDTADMHREFSRELPRGSRQTRKIRSKCRGNFGAKSGKMAFPDAAGEFVSGAVVGGRTWTSGLPGNAGASPHRCQ